MKINWKVAKDLMEDVFVLACYYVLRTIGLMLLIASVFCAWALFEYLFGIGGIF